MVSAGHLVPLDHGMQAGGRDAAGSLADLDQFKFAVMDQPIDRGARNPQFCLCHVDAVEQRPCCGAVGRVAAEAHHISYLLEKLGNGYLRKALSQFGFPARNSGISGWLLRRGG